MLEITGVSLIVLHVQAGPAHIEALLAVLKAVTKEETVQYVLACLVQLLLGTRFIIFPLHGRDRSLNRSIGMSRREPPARQAVPHAERPAHGSCPRALHSFPEVRAICG